MTLKLKMGIASSLVATCLLLPASVMGANDNVVPITINRPAPSTPRELTFDSLADLFPTGNTKLVNGQVIVDTSAWPGLFVARLNGGGHCTATLIGPRVVLTAAHCVDAGFGDRGETIGGRVNVGRTQYVMSGCKMHPDYVRADRLAIDLPRQSDDLALCELDGEPPITAETISTGPMVGAGSQLLMTGYGCTSIRVVANALAYDTVDQAGDERLRMGDALIEAVDVKDHGRAAGSYMRVRSVRSEPILCPGDSGGPALSGATLLQQRGPARRVVGVNSMVTALPNRTGYEFLSFMTTLNAQSFRDFLDEWTAVLDSRGVKVRVVCGADLKPGERNCRV